MRKKSSSLWKIAKTVLESFLLRYQSLASLAKLEAKLARYSIKKIIIFSAISLVIFLSSWFALLALLFVYLISLQFTSLMSMLIVFAVNLFILLILIAYTLSLKKDLSFSATRRQLKLTFKGFRKKS